MISVSPDRIRRHPQSVSLPRTSPFRRVSLTYSQEVRVVFVEIEIKQSWVIARSRNVSPIFAPTAD
jgi:hypothetical protein